MNSGFGCYVFWLKVFKFEENVYTQYRIQQQRGKGSLLIPFTRCHCCVPSSKRGHQWSLCVGCDFGSLECFREGIAMGFGGEFPEKGLELILKIQL